MRIFKVCFLFPVFLSIGVYGQEILNNNPPSVSWFQINTDHIDVIFPEGLSHKAQRMANTLEIISLPAGKSLDTEAKRISVILQRNNTIANGFVSQSPRRSEFNGMPPQDYSFSGVVDWYDFLAIHEYRHVVQFDKSVVGFNKFVKFIFGYEATHAMSHIGVPDWFWEGDAVNIETAFSKGGRGRIPEFNVLLRTNLLERGHFNYHRQYLRSFKYQVPDHYVFGHHFAAFLRNKYGMSTMSKSVNDTWALGFQPFRFSYCLKKNTGKTLIQNYDDMMIELDSVWRVQLEEITPSSYEMLNPRKNKAYTSYMYPHFLSDGRIAALKVGIGDVYQLVAIDPHKNEKRLHYIGPYSTSGILSIINDKIVWNEHRFDPRWRSIVYSDIVLYDVISGKTKTITKEGRYGSAALSPDGTKILSVETTNDLKFKLVILDAITGETISSFSMPDNELYVTPKWSDNGNEIISVIQSREGKALVVIQPGTGQMKILKPFSSENFGAPFMHENWVLYSSPISGIDNIFALNLETEQSFQVTESKFGAYHPVVSPDGSSILYNEFTKDGRDIALIPFSPSDWKPYSGEESHALHYVAALTQQENNAEILNNIPDTKYPVIPYKKGKKILNPYGWGPYLTTSLSELDIGIRSQDILSTTTMSAGYLLNSNEKTGTWYGDVSFQGWYPIISAHPFFGRRSMTEKTDTSTYDISWKEKGVKIGVKIPLLLTHSVYYEALDITMNTIYTKVNDYNVHFRYFDQIGNGSLISNQYIMSYRRLMNVSKRDIRSKFGQSFFLQYDHTPFGGDYTGEMFSIQARLYFPGLLKHHSLRGRLGMQFQDMAEEADSYRFSSPISYPRGYSYTPFETFYTTSADYAFPIWYMDFHVGSVLNIQRIKANLFHDYGYGSREDSSTGFHSTGVELSFDFNVMRYRRLLDMGVRYAYLDINDAHVFQFIIGSFGL